MTTSHIRKVRDNGNRIGAMGVSGLIAAAVGWAVVLRVLLTVRNWGPSRLSEEWAGIGFLIVALGISLFLLAASTEHPRKTARTIATVVVVGLGGVLAFVFLGPVWIESNETRSVEMGALGLLGSVPLFIALQIGLVSVAKDHPVSGRRPTARTLAVIYAALMAISIVSLIPRLF